MDRFPGHPYVELRKKDGTDCKLNCLQVVQDAIQKYLKEKGFTQNELNNLKFPNSRMIVEAKACQLCQQGTGKKSNTNKPLLCEEEEIFWSTQKLGGSSPTSLL